jgi:hypothetical protein
MRHPLIRLILCAALVTPVVVKPGEHLLDAWAEVSRPSRGGRCTRTSAMIDTRPQPLSTCADVPLRTVVSERRFP